ncbi:MAG: LacI family DNA-binding transcriptional regulator [Anaerolineae bacterium]|nr:LacI family DNA-binding transcriptional regulator [Anaerolineae bacterium]
MKRITMRDVADEVGVSKSTVSHVLNDTRFVADGTRQRVLDAVERLGYRPSQIARSLAVRHTHTVGLLISDVGNPFYPPVIKGVEEVALDHDYTVLFSNVSYDLDRIVGSIRTMIDRHIDGAIAMSSRFSSEMAAELLDNQIPTVLLDWDDEAMLPYREQVGLISFDFASGIREAARHLVDLGHRRFAHISGPPDVWTSRRRCDAFIGALVECGIAANEVMVVEGDLQIEGGRAALHRLVEAGQPPTAVFAANDLTALGMLWEARKIGLRIPEDISLIGLDDIPLAEQTTPALTTVALPIYETGQIAMTMLLEMICRENVEPSDDYFTRQVIPTRLIVRESTTRCPDLDSLGAVEDQ